MTFAAVEKGKKVMTMAEYIDREEAKKMVYQYSVFRAQLGGLMDVVSFLNDQPTVDVAPVRHGRWGANSDRPDSLICSVCNCGFDMWKHDPHNYCPNCGAKMDL